ncbi:MAG: hypothetical protein ABR974_06140 [Bacteroidales bacterium]
MTVPALFYMVSLTGQNEIQLVPSDLRQQTIVTEPVTLRKGFFRIGTLINYRVADRYFDNDGGKEYYVSSTWSTKSSYNFSLQYGISDRFEADVSTDYMHNKVKSQVAEITPGTNATTNVISKQVGLGFGDTHVDLKYQFLPDTKYKISLTGIIDATFPTGEKNPTNVKSATEYDLPVGNGTYAASGEIYARSIIFPYSFTAYLQYNYNFTGSKQIDVTDPAESRFKPGNRFETGLSANVHLNEWIVLANELSFYHEDEGWIESAGTVTIPESWAAVYVPNLVFQIKRFRLGESVSIPLTGRNTPADPLYIMMVQYVF